MSLQRWLPLESNPDVLNKYAYGIGMPDLWKFVDVYGLDPDSLAFIPQPVLAVVLLFPSTKHSKEHLLGRVVGDQIKDLYYTKQSKTIGNACGTIALVHAIANNMNSVELDPTSVLGNFLSDTKNSSPEERANSLEICKNMGAAHEESAQDGQTEAPDRNDEVDYHFVTFIDKSGCLYEMDGTRGGPVLHGNTSPMTLLTDAANIVKQFMERDPDEINFTVMALVDSSALL